MHRTLLLASFFALPALPAWANQATQQTTQPATTQPLQATITGLRSQSDGSSVHKPMPRPSAHIHELICAGVAPRQNRRWRRRWRGRRAWGASPRA